MKRTIYALVTVLIVFVAVFGVLVLRPVPKVKAGHHGCSNATLNGSYGLVGSGIYDDLPANASAQVNFNGQGQVSGVVDLMTVNGEYKTDYSFSGITYTVNSTTCAFQVIFTDPSLFSGSATLAGTVVDSGTHVIGNVVGSGYNLTATFDIKKVASEEDHDAF
jgi:hypothetical protein